MTATVFAVSDPERDAGPAAAAGDGPACVHLDPWWKGVAGLDPDWPVFLRGPGSYDYAAARVAAALAARFVQLEVRGSRLLNVRPAGYDHAVRWRAWLAAACGDADFDYRKTILWQVCEGQEHAGPGDLLAIARELHAALPLPTGGN